MTIHRFLGSFAVLFAAVTLLAQAPPKTHLKVGDHSP
jgi:hypothetical protein